MGIETLHDVIVIDRLRPKRLPQHVGSNRILLLFRLVWQLEGIAGNPPTVITDPGSQQDEHEAKRQNS